MRRVVLKNLKLGDPDDVEIYAAAAIWDWMQKDEFTQLKKYGLTEKDMFWYRGVMLPHSITIDVCADVDNDTEILLRLAGLCA